MSLRLDEEEQDRFFTDKVKQKEESNHSNIGITSSDEDLDSEDIKDQKCLTLRVLQRILPCVKNKSVWEPSQGDVFKTQEVEETKYPRSLRMLENPVLDFLFVFSALLSVFMLIFSFGFLIESRLLWAIMHCINSVYTFCVFTHWLRILIKSKYAKTNQGYSTEDCVFSVLSVAPVDIIVLVIYVLNEGSDNGEDNPVAPYITISRLNYLFRIRSVLLYFSNWDNELKVGDFKMFILRTFLYLLYLLHLTCCIWHRIACQSFKMSHFRMDPLQATTEVCSNNEGNNWVTSLLNVKGSPVLRHRWHPLLEHYLASIYWAICITFRLGTVDIDASLISDEEVAFTAVTQIASWIFIIVYVSGCLTSLLVEMDSEREHFLTRRYAIERYLDFSDVTKQIRMDVNRFYDYLWARSRGIHNWDMVEEMPLTMRSEIYFDVNKFVLDQIPLLVNMEEAFLMNLSLRMKHSFYLRGEILRRKNDTGMAMFYVINGHLEILSDDESHPIAEIRSGSIIGELYLLQSYPRVATIKCGTECDIMVLTKRDFKAVLQMYPEYLPLLVERLEKRLEQSGLLIALCEKHNEYPKAFQRLEEMKSEHEEKDNYYQHTYEIVTNVLDTSLTFDSQKDTRNSDDYDGLSLNPEMKKRLTKPIIETARENPLSRQQATAAAYLALEIDVNRAASLAKDLNIARPPLTVAAPSIYQVGDPKAHTNSANKRSKTIALHLIPKISDYAERRSAIFVLWKTLILFGIISVVWYYPYQFAFGVRPGAQGHFDYIFHFIDVLFAADFVMDMLRMIITPHKTLEVPSEILAYRAKTAYFYIRLFSFLPIEYVLGPMIGIRGGSGGNRFYYMLKFNRLIQYYEGIKYFIGFEGDSKLPPELLFIIKTSMRLFFLLHVFAVFLEVLLMDIMVGQSISKDVPEIDDWMLRNYEFVFYCAVEVLTSTGYDDIPLYSDGAIGYTVIGLMLGGCMVIFLGAKVSSILVNSERRRVTFKQTFYGLRKFMKERKFPKSLSSRVQNYYHLQWKSHEGVLLPHEKSIIWDAPKALFRKVAVAQAKKYVERIPLFRYCSEVVITEVCTALRQFIVSPKEVILYPSDRARELYIIVKGFCQVTYNDVIIGTLSEGQYFGLPGLIYGTNKPVQISTMTHCQFFCLEFETFTEIAKKFPKFLQEFKLLRGDATFSRSKYLMIDTDEQEIPFPEQGPTLPVFERLHEESNKDDKKGSILAETPSDTAVIEVPSASAPAVAVPSGLVVLEETYIEKPKFNICWSILPNGRFLKYWTIFRVVTAVIITNFVPIQFSFTIHPTTSLFTVLIFDIIAWIDIYLCFHVGYYGIENQLVTARWKTVLHYLKGPFLFDFLASFPLDLLIILSSSSIKPFESPPQYDGMYWLVSGVRLNRMLQIYRLFVSGTVLEKMIFRSLPFITLVQVVPWMFTFLNIASCISILAVCGPSSNGEPIKCEEFAWILHGKIYDDIDLNENDSFLFYIRAFYWVSVSALCVGFGDIIVVNHPTNRCVAIAVIFFGTIVSGYLISKLTACLIGEDSRRIEIREKTKIIFKFLEQFNVPRDLRRRVKECYSCAWDKSKGIYPNDLFSALTPTLKSDVMRKLYEESLRRSPLFETLEMPGIRILATKLTEYVYPEGEFVVKYGDLNSDVFYVSKGVVVAYTEHGDVITYMGTGSLVGEMSALFDVQRLHTAVAATDVEMFVFKKEDFLDFLSLYPDLKETLEQACVLHYKETIEATAKSVGVKVIVPISNDGEYIGADDEIPPVDGPAEGNKSTEKFITIPDEEPEIVVHGGLSADKLSKIESAIAEAESRIKPDEQAEESLIHQDPLRLPVKTETVKESEKEEREAYRRYWLSYFITYGRIPRDEMGLLHIFQEKHKFTCRDFVIHPATPICSWVSLYLFITSLSCGLTAYEIAFSTDQEATNLVIFRCSLEIFFIIRIFGNFHLGYYGEGGVIVYDIHKIAKRYARSWNGLAIDVITTLPLYLLSYIMGNLTNKNLSADIRGLQLLRMLLFARYLHETETDLRMKGSRVKIIKVSILLCFIFHFCACAWYLVACSGMTCNKDSWMSIVLKNLEDHSKITKDSDISIGSRYLLALYYVTTAITFTGISDITPRTMTELCTTIGMLFATIFVIGFLVGEMTQCLASQVASKIHYQHKLSVMEHHFAALGLSTSKLTEVRQYFRLLWLKCNGMVYTEIIAELPYPLRTDILTKIYGQNLRNSRLLGRLDETIIRQLCSRVQHEIFMPGARIVRSGDVCVGIYFIKKGEVVILDERSNLDLCVEILYENECFGEVKVFLKKEQFRFSYIARLETEMGVLFAKDLEEVLGRHSGVYEELFTKASTFRSNRMALKEEENQIPLRSLSNQKITT